ncbi:MAG: PAS domain S-box protein [Pseudomonadota bacterium]
MDYSEPSVLKLLVAVGDPAQITRVGELLAGASVACAVDARSDPADVLALLQGGEHDLCLLDAGMRLPDGEDLLRCARAAGSRMPVILLLDADTPCSEDCVAEHGAQDALYKHTLLATALRRSIRNAIAKARILDQLAVSQQRLHRHELELTRLQAALDQHAIVSAADIDGNITYANDKFCEVSGYAREELIGRNHRLLKSGVHPDAFYEEMWRTLAGGQSWQGEICNRRKDGSRYWVRSTIVPFSGADGLPYQYVSIRTDITAIKEAESRLRLMGKALEASVDGIAIADASQPDLPLIYVNPAFERLSGYAQEELIGRNCRFLQGDDQGQLGLDEVRAALREGRSARALLRNYRKDGGLFWNDLSIAPVRDDGGRITHFIGVANDVTARHDAETALLHSEERLRRSQVYANIGTWDWNIQTGELFWSERIGPLFGYDSLVETTYENFLAAVHPEDRRRVVEAVNACVERGDKYDIEHRCVWPDGTVRWMLERGDVTRDPAGRPLHMLGVVQDITDRKLAEQKLQASEASLANAQRIARLGSFDWNPVTDTLHWSDEHYRLWGLEPGSVTPSYALFRQGVHPDDVARVETLLNAALEGGRHYDCQHRVRRPDGSVRTIHGRGEVMFDAGGRAVRMAGTVQDITELDQAQRQIRDIGERFRALVETTADWIWEVDAEGRYTYASPRVRELLGHDPEEVLGKTPFDFMPPAEARRVRDAFASIAGARRPLRNLVNRNLRRDGSEVVLETSGVPILADDGGFLGYRGIDRDITDRIERERLLETARQEADRANQAKSMFLSSMSHELRTPLNAILGFAQLLQIQKGLDTEQLENVEEILKAGRHLLELVNEVLDLAKIDAGAINLNIEPVDCAGLVREAVNLVRVMAERQGIDLRGEFGDTCHAGFLADRTRLKQVLVNLLSNAIKYNRPHGSVTLRLVPGAQGFGRIEVSDTGLGLSAAQQEELFQPFHRLHGAESNIEGHGIGLAICKRLADAMGGRIGVASTPGVGSTFWLELPLAGDAAVPMDDHEAPRDEQGARDCRPATILYVEDDPANLRLVRNLFATRPGWTLLTAETAGQGLERAAMEPVDLILLDINLPGMDGYHVLERLRAMERTAAIPVVALTARATRDAIARGLAAGFAAYLTKPLDVAGFWSCLEALLCGRAADNELSETT